MAGRTGEEKESDRFMKQLLKGGVVVSGSASYPADVLLDGERIAAMGEPGGLDETAGRDARVYDVSGCLLFPGFIDAHTHFDLHVAGTVTADDFATGTKAALRGGTTTIVDFGTQYKGESLAQGLSNWHEKADGKCSCDYGFHMSITDWNPQVSREVQDMMDAGVSSFKLYMTYDTQVDDATMFEILRRLKEVGGITGVHCENNGMIAALQREAVAQGKMGVSSHPATRPAAAEAEAIDRLLRLAEVVDIPVVVVHLTCKEGYDVIMEARRRGQKVYAETCPQYLLMDDSLYGLPGMEGAKYVCAPPLRKAGDCACLWKGLAQGDIQTVSTDHCSFTTAQKALGAGDFRKIPGGMPGVETRGVLLYTYGVDEGRITKEQMCAVLSENPAKLYGMYPKKGVIAPGSDGDIVVLRPGTEGVISAADQIQNVDYAPFEGTRITARVERVFLRGELAVEDGTVIREKRGRFVKRGRYGL